MGTNLSDIKYKLDNEQLILAIPSGPSLDAFEKILNRALNCWPDCPPEYKHLADILMHGKPLQDYYKEPKPRKVSLAGQPTST